MGEMPLTVKEKAWRRDTQGFIIFEECEDAQRKKSLPGFGKRVLWPCTLESKKAKSRRKFRGIQQKGVARPRKGS